jgi:hypothetical protein
MSYPLDFALTRARYDDLLREAEEERLLRRARKQSEPWFSRLSKLLTRPSQELETTLDSQPLASVR